MLAVAALIFLVVFLAVPALQRNQRDDARKRDVSMVVEAVTNYNANADKTNLVSNTGAYASGAVYRSGSALTANLSPYFDKLSNSIDYVHVVHNPTIPTTFSASLTVANGNAATSQTAPMLNNIVIYQQAQCNANVGLVRGSARQSAVVIQIETGGTGKYYCQNAS